MRSERKELERFIRLLPETNSNLKRKNNEENSTEDSSVNNDIDSLAMELMEDDSLYSTLETENNKKLRIPGLTFNFSKEKTEELIKIFNFGEENMVDKKDIDRLIKEPNYLPDRPFENEEIQKILKLYQNNLSNEGIKYLKSMSEKSMKEINPELYKKINRIENNNKEKKLPIEYNKFIDLEAEKLIKLFNSIKN